MTLEKLKRKRALQKEQRDKRMETYKKFKELMRYQIQIEDAAIDKQ